MHEQNPTLQYIRGSLWGAVLGDVIGAFLQFTSGINQSKVKEAFMIKGGGMHKLQAGQPTDDSQLAYAVAKGLIRGKGQLNLNYIAQQMGNWYQSKPIDVGGTIKNAVPKACGMKSHQAHLVRKGARQKSQKSLSNGSLMAITPLSIWCHRLKPEQIIQSIHQYTILIHPNPSVILINTFYTLVICYLLNNQTQIQKRKNAYNYAKQQLQKTISESPNKQQFQGWLSVIEKSFQDPEILFKELPANKAQGWARIAFSYTMVLLVQGEKYRKTIEKLLLQKGDTDTNACIVGGCIGASWKVRQLEMDAEIQKISKWRPKKVNRPSWMVPGLVVEDISKKLSEISPSQLLIIGSESEYKK